MTIAIISHPNCALHDPGSGHPEQPARFTTIQKALETYFNQPAAQFYLASKATRSQLYAAHAKDYIDWIFSISPKEGQIAIDADTIMNVHTLNAALYAAGAVVFAVDLVMQNKARVAFCNVRPPGHHAEWAKAMGFCFFNNVAVGVMHARREYGLERIAIVDFDVHHGNGTQNIFQANKAVMYCSSFQHPFYPGYAAEMDTTHILTVPLSAGTDGKLFREKVATAWFEKLTAFQPELIFFSAGFDGHINDPLANFALTVDDYVWLTQKIATIAKTFSQGRMISVLEGGYNLQALAECVPAHVHAMDQD